MLQLQTTLPAVDWDRPWLAPFRQTAQSVLAEKHWRTAVNAIARRRQLINHLDLPIHFVDQSELPAGVAYETFISRTGQVPTRDNLHDFFNALAWLTYPVAKSGLNAIQAAEIARLSELAALQPIRAGAGEVLPIPAPIQNSRSERGVVRDRATLFDENAAVLVASQPAVEVALRAHEWLHALLTLRPAFGRCCEVRLFGHALIEKLVNPYKAITAHVWVLSVEPAFFDLNEDDKRTHLDALLGSAVNEGLLGVPAMGLPVLGVPGWWHDQDAMFYEDKAVFRPKRSL